MAITLAESRDNPAGMGNVIGRALVLINAIPATIACIFHNTLRERSVDSWQND